MSTITAIITAMLGLIGALVLAVLSNELFENLPWLTRKIVRLTARIEADDSDTADLLYGDLMYGIESIPGKLISLCVALGFLFKVAVLRRVRDMCTSAPVNGRRADQDSLRPAAAADCCGQQQRSMLIQAWIEVVTRASFVPGGHARARTVVEDSLQLLAAAMIAEPFDAAPGYRVGVELVNAKIASPKSLGSTLTLQPGPVQSSQ